MRILVDEISNLDRIDQQPVGKEMRYYYVPRDSEALFCLVSRCGVLEFLIGRVVDAAIGWSVGWHGKCRPDQEGLQLRKVTLFRKLDSGNYDTTLSALIAESRNLRRQKPRKGAKWAIPYGFEDNSSDKGFVLKHRQPRRKR